MKDTHNINSEQALKIIRSVIYYNTLLRIFKQFYFNVSILKKQSVTEQDVTDVYLNLFNIESNIQVLPNHASLLKRYVVKPL